MENATHIEVLLEFGHLTIHDNSVVQVHINPGVHIRNREAQKIMETINGLSRYTSRPVVVDMRSIERIDTSAKLYFLAKQGDNQNQSVAIVISSSIGRVLANLSLLFQQCSCPTRYFTTDTAAIKWSERFLAHEQGQMQTMAA
jgi:anti-anti-sigma regulatory factor